MELAVENLYGGLELFRQGKISDSSNLKKLKLYQFVILFWYESFDAEFFWYAIYGIRTTAIISWLDSTAHGGMKRFKKGNVEAFRNQAPVE